MEYLRGTLLQFAFIAVFIGGMFVMGDVLAWLFGVLWLLGKSVFG